MKHTTEELLFAAAVRQRVGDMRSARLLHMTDEQATEFRKQPANDLIEEAVRELEGFANIIAKLREESAS